MKRTTLWAAVGVVGILSATGIVALFGRGGLSEAPPVCWRGDEAGGTDGTSGTGGIGGTGDPGSGAANGAGAAAPATASGADAGCAPVVTPDDLPRSRRVVLGDPDVSGMDGWPGQFDVAPTLFDLDGDGTDEVIVHSNDTMVYVYAADGRVVAALPTTYPEGWFIERILNGVAAGILEPGEAPSIVVTDHAAYVAVWQVQPFRGAPGQIAFQLSWERRMTECYWNPGMDARPTLADVDGDGRLDILVQTEEVGFYALRSDTGETLWAQCWAGGNSEPVAGDLDGDGRLEVVVASDDGLVAVLEGATGEPLWTFNAALHVRPAAIPIAPTIVDLDGVGEKEVLFTARVAPDADPATWPQAHMAIFAVHRNPETWQAELLWMRQPDWANPLSHTRLAVLDVDGDGAMDIFGMDWNTIGHSPGHWERLGPAHAFRLDRDGNDVWVRSLDTWWSNKDIAIADTDGDGVLEVLANGPAPNGYDSIVSLDVATGEPVRYLVLPGWQVMRGPVYADLRHDGRMQALIPVAPAAGAVRGAILLFELDVPHNAPWKGTP